MRTRKRREGWREGGRGGEREDDGRDGWKEGGREGRMQAARRRAKEKGTTQANTPFLTGGSDSNSSLGVLPGARTKSKLD